MDRDESPSPTNAILVSPHKKTSCVMIPQPPPPQRTASDDSCNSHATFNSISTGNTSITTIAEIDSLNQREGSQVPVLTVITKSAPDRGVTSRLVTQKEGENNDATESVHPTSSKNHFIVGENENGGRKCRFILPDGRAHELGKHLGNDVLDESSEEDEEQDANNTEALLPTPVPNNPSTSSWKKLKGPRTSRKKGLGGHETGRRNSLRQRTPSFWTTNWRNGTIMLWVVLMVLGAGMMWVVIENEGNGGAGRAIPPVEELAFSEVSSKLNSKLGPLPEPKRRFPRSSHLSSLHTSRASHPSSLWLYDSPVVLYFRLGRNHDPLITVKHAAVSSDVEICSKIGVDLMKAGGNAIDAVIGTGACIGTVNMFASGIGGGGFGVVYLAHGESKSFNFREMAPARADKDMFKHNHLLAQAGGLAFAIPGEVHGYWTMHQKYGKLPWKDLWVPSINLNRNGFPVTEKLAQVIQFGAPVFLNNTEDWNFVFSNSKSGDLQLLTEGEIMKRPALADTLEIISRDYEGIQEFYNGTIAKSLASYAQKYGGIITAEDFSKFYTVIEPTVSTTVSLVSDKKHKQKFYTCPAPCSGPVLLEGLNIAEGLDLQNPSDPVTFHRVIEIMKWISAGRTELGDPADPSADNSDRVQELLTKEYAASVRQNISDYQTFNYTHYHPSYEANDPKGTSHISVLDSYGNAVALTTTVNLYWGASIHDPKTGIVLNSEMDDFSIPSRPNAYNLYPSVYNYIKPYKRPLSSTSPTITVNVKTNKVEFIIGASGGSRIVTSVFECLVKYFLWDFGLLDTIRSARAHHQLIPEVAFLEQGVSKELEAGLRARGHKTERVDWVGSVVNGIAVTYDGSGAGRREGKTIFAVADWWRKRGKAAGY